MIIDKIIEKLKPIEKNIYSGMAKDLPADEDWNYIVVSKDSFSKIDKSNVNAKTAINIVIVHEDFIQDEFIKDVINAVKDIPNLTFCSGENNYYYEKKGNTQLVVVMLPLQFSYITHLR